tara:strand:+ start:487 stop:930 length:444 start_codon:yes stop_codon:yes gene_type:complete
MNNEEKNNLKLIGKNEDDLKIVSAYLQDSIVIVKDIVFLKKNKTFIMILNRFMWEEAFRANKRKRIRCAVKFEEVIEVQSKNINQKNKKKPLEYLAIEPIKISSGSFKINIFFSGGGIITIISEVIEVALNDLGSPWNVEYFPAHKI